MSDSNQAQEESFSTEKLTVTGSSTLSDLTVTGPATFAQLQSNSIFLPSTTPANTATRLYNTAGDLYWNGSLIAGAGIGNWNTDGTNAWRATGNVGIGTTTPNVKLHVGTAADATFAGTEVIFASDDNAPGGLEVRNTFRGTFNDSRVSTMADDGSYITLAQPSTLNIFSIFGLERASTSLLFNFAGSEGGAARDMAIGTFDSADLIFGTANAERLRITDAGNVGIGTTTPTERLSVAGNINLTGDLLFNGTGMGINNLSDGRVAGNSTFLGLNAGLNDDGTDNKNVGVGEGALQANTSGVNNTAVGMRALLANTTGNSNTATGFESLQSNTTGGSNTANGRSALQSNTTGSNNAANGFQALGSNTTGGNNTATGYRTLYANTTGSNNVASGLNTLYELTTGSNNLALGHNTARGITTGSNNTILGANVTGLAAGLSNNIIIADGAGNRRINVDGSGNVGIGTDSPEAKLHVSDTTAGQILISDTGASGLKHALLESNEGNFNLTSLNNTFVTHVTPLSIDLNTQEATFGGPVRVNGTNGLNIKNDYRILVENNNFVIEDTVSAQNIFTIEDQGTVNSLYITSTGNVGIGTTTPSAQLTVASTVRLAGITGGTLETDALGNVTVSSDERLKDIEGNYTPGLQAILGLQPIEYRWNTVSGFDQATVYAGFSAQNVETVIPEAVGEDGRGYKTLSTRPILAAVVTAIQEVWTTLTEYMNRTEDLERMLVEQQVQTAAQQARIEALEAELDIVPADEPVVEPATGQPPVETDSVDTDEDEVVEDNLVSESDEPDVPSATVPDTAADDVSTDDTDTAAADSPVVNDEEDGVEIDVVDDISDESDETTEVETAENSSEETAEATEPESDSPAETEVDEGEEAGGAV